MKLEDARSSHPCLPTVRYVARMGLVVTDSAVKKIQKSVRLFARDAYAPVLVASTVFMGVAIRRANRQWQILCKPDLSGPKTIEMSQQKLDVSRVIIEKDDVVVFSFLPGGTKEIRLYYSAAIRDWAGVAIVEELSWNSWLAVAIQKPRQ